MADLKLYLRNPHFAPDITDFSEDCDRLDRCQEEAMHYFKRATKEALQEFTNSVVAMQPYYGSPRWDRERAAVKAKYSNATAVARELYTASVDELFKTGELSEATSFKWTEIIVQQAVQLQAAE